MKKNIYLTVFCLCLLSVASISCSKENPIAQPELTVSTEEISLTEDGATKTFHIKSNVAWQITSSEAWCTVSPSSGNAGTIRIDATIDENETFVERIASITVTAGSLSKQLQITQDGSVLLTVTEDEFDVQAEGDIITVSVQSSGSHQHTIDSDWITLLPGGGIGNLLFSVRQNPALFGRSGTITFTLEDLTQVVTIAQEGQPLTIEASQEGMDHDAINLAPLMKGGWNLGNTMEATGVNNGVVTASETMWGNPLTTKTLIDGVKAAGFTTVRIPCAWSGYIEDATTYKIKDSWLARVKEVIDYCVDNDMYVMINIHWDGGWLENNPVYSKQVEVNKKQKALWEQIAVYFRDYDEHLLFAGVNEVHFDYGTPTAEHLEVHQSYLQTFVDAVRSTGGRNTYRNLIVQGYNTNIGHTDNHFYMPTDPTSNRMMAEVHFYDPYDFVLDQTSTKYYWGADFTGLGNTSTWGQEAWVDSEFARMKAKFIDNNIPVIMGEYGPMFRASLTGQTLLNHTASRNHYLNYVTKKAMEIGIVPVYWDNGPMGNNSSGLFNRNTGAVADTNAVQAIVSALND